MSSEIAIKVENLSKVYHIYDQPRDRLKQFILPRMRSMVGQLSENYFREFWALKDISFEIKKGETVGVIGRNGSGKSTLLQMICGTLNPTSGSIQTCGRIAALLELGSGFNIEFTGRENVYMYAAVLGLSKEEVDTRFDDIASFAGIGDFIEQPVKIYSSGMVVRLAFAVSVCVDPNILVIDEALAVGDAAFQFKCLERMRLLTKSGTTLLFVSHDIGMVKSFCHHVIYLEHGQEKMQGQPEVVAEQYFLDLRDEQSRQSTGAGLVFRKKNLGASNLTAFGTAQGHIVSACFLPDESMNMVVSGGEKVRIRIESEYDPNLPGAAISMILLDRRMLDIAGKYFFLREKTVKNGKYVAEIDLEFEARLRPGTYFITLRLESRLMGQNFMPVDKQPAALSFKVTPYEPEFLGTVDIGVRQVPSFTVPALLSGKKRVVALLAVRNEALYLPRCLEHLNEQGVETCIIDNDSTDDSLEIARGYKNKGVFRIERYPYPGYFDWVGLLSMKERLAEEINAEWFIHHDADEIREAPVQYSTLSNALLEVERAGYNAVNFDEFVFLPTGSAWENDEPRDFVFEFRDYYYFCPRPLHRVNAWKKQTGQVDLVTRGGHQVLFNDRHVCPDSFILRHYIALNLNHLLRKYGQERIYNPKEVEERKWHGTCARFDPNKVKLPLRENLRNLDVEGWVRSTPVIKHPFFGE